MRNLIRTTVGKAFRGLLDRNYYSAKMYYMYQLGSAQRKFGGTPLLVYQMGKVGSSTIIDSLHAIGIDRPIYHIHFLTKERIAKTEEDRKEFFRTENYSYLKRPWLYEFLVKQLDAGLEERKWKIVTLTREAIARNISSFFENLKVESFDEADRYEISSHYYRIPPTTIRLNDLEGLTKLFFERLNHDSPLQFFDREVKEVFGVDVFDRDFPAAKGFTIYESDLADILLIRLEDLNRVAEEAFREFLDIEDFRLVGANIGSDKHYAPLYKSFREHLELPDDYLNRVYTSKYMRHFYTEGEIRTFDEKWRKMGKRRIG